MESNIDINDLWRRYKEENDKKAREDIIYFYIPFVEAISNKISVWLPSFIDLEDLISSGIVGLISAVDRFDINSGVKFETYAYWRIKGEIIDFLRKRDVLSKQQRAKIKKMEESWDELEVASGNAVDESLVAERMGIGVEEVRELMKLSQLSKVISLNEKNSDGFELETVLADDGDAVEAIENRLLVDLLRKHMEKLDYKEQQILYLYYTERLTLKEIGDVLGISESRVSQLLSKIVFGLRKKMEKEGVLG